VPFTSIALWTGRILVASLFILGGINKIGSYSETLQRMTESGLPLPDILLPLTILLELGGGLIVASGRFHSGLVALLLAGYTLVVNLVFHPFWALAGQQQAIELSLFFKNISVIGGLMVIAAIDLKKAARTAEGTL
jgi:putative oxidoreductase